MESFPSSGEGGKELDRLTSGEISESGRKHPLYVHRHTPPRRPVRRAETGDPEFNQLWNEYHRLDKSEFDDGNVVPGEVVSSSLDEPDASE